MSAIAAGSSGLLTVEEFLRIERERGHDAPAELVRGKVVRMSPPKPYHGLVCMNAAALLWEYVRAHDLGYLLTNDAGVITGRNPDTLRGADVAFSSYARVSKGSLPMDRYLDVPPDLVVEVRSPDDRWPKLLEKVAEYLNAGVPTVVVLDPERRNAHVYAADDPVRLLGEADELALPGILPGFAAAVGRFFE